MVVAPVDDGDPGRRPTERLGRRQSAEARADNDDSRALFGRGGRALPHRARGGHGLAAGAGPLIRQHLALHRFKSVDHVAAADAPLRALAATPAVAARGRLAPRSRSLPRTGLPYEPGRDFPRPRAGRLESSGRGARASLSSRLVRHIRCADIASPTTSTPKMTTLRRVASAVTILPIHPWTMAAANSEMASRLMSAKWNTILWRCDAGSAWEGKRAVASFQLCPAPLRPRPRSRRTRCSSDGNPASKLVTAILLISIAARCGLVGGCQSRTDSVTSTMSRRVSGSLMALVTTPRPLRLFTR